MHTVPSLLRFAAVVTAATVLGTACAPGPALGPVDKPVRQISSLEPPQEVIILAPEMNTTSLSRAVPLIGKCTDPAVREVSIDIDGSVFILKVKDGVFSTILIPREGDNHILIRAEGSAPVALVITYLASIPESSDRPYRSHGIVRKQDCTFCHAEGSWIFSSDEEVSRNCAKCHKTRELCAKRLSGLAAVTRCTDCHEPHGGSNPELLTRTGMSHRR